MYIESHSMKNFRRANKGNLSRIAWKHFQVSQKWEKFWIEKKKNDVETFISTWTYIIPGSGIVLCYTRTMTRPFLFPSTYLQVFYFLFTCILRSLLDEPPGWSSRDRCIHVCTHRYDLPNITCTSPVHRLTLL